MPVIYIDVLLALNLFIDFLLLLATVRILRIPYRRWRLVLGALFGSMCSTLIFLPDLNMVLGTLVKLVSAAMIILISFKWVNVMAYIKQLTVFFVISTLFAGVAMAVWFFAAPAGFYVQGGVVYYDVDPLTLVILTVISYGVIWVYDRVTQKKQPKGKDFRLLIDCGGGTAGVRALYDTGNGLTEMFSGNPVVVVRYAAIAHILPPSLQQALRTQASGWKTGEEVSGEGTTYADGEGAVQTAVRAKLRLVPFQSVGGNGLLPAFQPAHVTAVAQNGTSRDITGAYVAVCDTLGRGEYEALIGSDIADLFA